MGGLVGIDVRVLDEDFSDGLRRRILYAANQCPDIAWPVQKNIYVSAARHLDVTVRRAIDHVVNRRRHVVE